VSPVISAFGVEHGVSKSLHGERGDKRNTKYVAAGIVGGIAGAHAGAHAGAAAGRTTLYRIKRAAHAMTGEVHAVKGAEHALEGAYTGRRAGLLAGAGGYAAYRHHKGLGRPKPAPARSKR
jgi:hypothetical protein